jgi:hypothetical protein
MPAKPQPRRLRNTEERKPRGRVPVKNANHALQGEERKPAEERALREERAPVKNAAHVKPWFRAGEFVNHFTA